MNDVKLFLESCQNLMLYALVTLSLGVLMVSLAVALMKSVKLSAVKICRYGFLGVFLMSVMLGIGVSIGSVKVPGDPTNQVQQGQVSGEPLRRPGGWPPYHAGGSVGSRVPRDRNAGNTAYPITDEDITNCWRVAEMREGCEIVSRDAFGAPQIHEDWLVRGGFMDVMRIHAVGWSFPWCDGFLEGMTVFSDGGLRPSLRTPYFPSPFEAPLAVVPSFNWNLLPGGVSNVFWHAVSPSNSLVVTWENSPVNRNVNCITNFQAELFTDGSFEYRYQDQTIGYLPVFPFDWDNDGLENTIDPEPLVAGPDAHGTNEEWYNVVCANIFNSNAYYFVDVVADRGPVPICFNADRESLLGSPIVIARGGETNHVPLLMGVEYAVISMVPFSVSAPSNAVVTINGFNDGRSFTVKWPLSFDLSPDDGGYAVGVQPFDPGGAFSWTPGLCGGIGPRLLSGGSSCSFVASGSWVGFTRCGDCECGGTSIDGTYTLEGAAFTVPSVWCGCTAVGSGFPGMPQLPASVSVSFDKAVVFYEDAYTNAPNVVVGRNSTTNILSVSAYGGESGGLLRIGQHNMDKLRRIGGAAVTLPYSAMLPPMGSVSFSVEYEAAKHSDAENDISVDASLTPMGGGAMVSASASNTVVRVQLEAICGAPLDGNTSRHEYGVKEEVACWHWPNSVYATWSTSKGEISPLGSFSHSFQAPLDGGESVLTISVNNETYSTTCMILEPEKYYCGRATKFGFGLGENMAGGVGMFLELYIVPRTVSFGRIAMQEVPTTTGGVSGYFQNEEFSAEWAHTRDHRAGMWHNIGNDNLFMSEDEASMSLNLKRMTPDGVLTNDVSFGWQEGMILWSIPLGWNLHDTNGESLPVRTNAVPEQQKFVILPNGTVGIMKAGYYVTRGTNTIIAAGRLQE